MSIDEIKSGLAEKTQSSGKLNYIQLIEQTGIVGKIASVVLGVLIITISILVPLIITLELCYIAFPIVREKMDELSIKVEETGFAKKALGFALHDAREAVEQANTVQIGQKSAMLIYIQLKSKSMMFIALVISLVIAGSETIINFVWGLIEGVIDVVF